MERKKIKNPWIGREGYNCFGCAPHNEYGLKMEFYEEGDKVVSLWQPSPQYQGWIDTLHGGIQAVLLDEICAWVVLRKLQRAGVTSKMETRYMKPVSVRDENLWLEALIVEQRRNLVTVDAYIYNKVGELCTQARCIYFTFSAEKSREEMGFEGCELEK